MKKVRTRLSRAVYLPAWVALAKLAGGLVKGYRKLGPLRGESGCKQTAN